MKTNGQKDKIIGSRAQVWHGTATHTSGGLTKDKLMMNNRKRIVSIARHNIGKSALEYLKKSGHAGVLPKDRKKKMAGGEVQSARTEEAEIARKEAEARELMNR